MISASLAAQDHLGIGSTVSFLGDTDFVTYRVVGILAGDGPWATRTDRTVLVPLATAQAAFGTDTLTRLDLGLAEGATLGDVMDTLESDLDEQPYVLSTPADLAAAMRASTTDFAATTALIAAVALFAGAFLIFNTLSMTVVERVRELGLLRAAGATRGQLTSFILVQATVIGVLGTVVGIVLGAVLALGDDRLGCRRSARSGSAGRSSGPADVVTAFVDRPGRDRRGRTRAGPPGRSDPAGRGPQVTIRAADGASRAPALARRRLRPDRRRRAARVAPGRR